MSDGADNTQVGDITIFDTAYFDQDYKLQAIWLGLLWFLLGTIPTIAYNVYVTTLSFGWVMSAGEVHAWAVTRWALGDAFWVLGIFWLLAYIKSVDSRLMQKIYYRAIAWIIPLSWVFLLWILIAFIVGATQTWGSTASIGFGIGMLVTYGGLEALAWYLAPRVVKFYKWDQQDWWNYNKDEPLDTWPKQLGDFVEY